MLRAPAIVLSDIWNEFFAPSTFLFSRSENRLFRLGRRSDKESSLAHSAGTSSVIRRAVQGDSAARNELIGQCRPLVRVAANRCARRLYRGRFDESDVVQLACLEAFASFDDFRGQTRNELLGWLQTILERTVWQLVRRHSAQKRDIRRELAADSEMSFFWHSIGKPLSTPSMKLIAGEAALIVVTALETLPDELREAVQLRYLEGLKIREIAAQQQASVGQVAGRLRRGLAALHRELPTELQNELMGDAG